MSTLIYLALLVLLGAASAFPGTPSELRTRNYTYTFEEYMTDFGKKYESAAELSMRRSLFEMRLEAVRMHNEHQSPPPSWRKGLNTLSDRTNEELRQLNGYDRAMGRAALASQSASLSMEVPAFNAEDLAALPESLDWRAVPGVLTSVKDQGNCGCCWVFSAVSTLESRWFLTSNTTMDLSVQSVISCARNPHHCGGIGGCDGGIPEVAFSYVMENNGLSEEWTWPFIQYNNNITTPCPIVKKANSTVRNVVSITGYRKLPSNNYVAVMQALQHGPLSIIVDASGWSDYASGVYDGCDRKKVTLDHAVQLVGYGVDITMSTPVPYWIIRNSWGVDFGENGYIRIARSSGAETCGIDYSDGPGCDGSPDQVTVCGGCGLLFDVSYPEISTSNDEEIMTAQMK